MCRCSMWGWGWRGMLCGICYIWAYTSVKRHRAHVSNVEHSSSSTDLCPKRLTATSALCTRVLCTLCLFVMFVSLIGQAAAPGGPRPPPPPPPLPGDLFFTTSTELLLALGWQIVSNGGWISSSSSSSGSSTSTHSACLFLQRLCMLHHLIERQ